MFLACSGIIDIDSAIQELVETVRIKFHCRFFGKDEDDIQPEDITSAASLAHHRVLDYDTVEYLSLNDVGGKNISIIVNSSVKMAFVLND